MKKLPQGVFKDQDGLQFRVLYYDSRSKCYRVEYLNMMGMRRWVPVEDIGEGKRYQSMGVWGHLLLQRLNLKAGRPVLNVADAVCE